MQGASVNRARMSVDVKAPSESQIGHGSWRERKESVGRRTISASRTSGAQNNQRTQQATSSNHHGHGRGYKHNAERQYSQPAAGRIGRKRRFSERAPGEGHGHPFKRRFGRYGRHERIVLPTKFLLGGNITDPLNLNSLCDEEINKALNENTPVSSPLPIPPHRSEVKVLIPPNIRDPLGLDSDIDPNLTSPKLPEVKKRKHKRKNMAKLAISPIVHKDDSIPHDNSAVPPSKLTKDITKPMHINIDSSISTSTGSKSSGSHYRDSSSEAVSAAVQKKIQDKIVSPVIPQISPKKRKRKSSECHSDNGSHCSVARTLSKDSDKQIKCDKTSPHRPKFRKQTSNQSNGSCSKHHHHRRASGTHQKQQKQQDKFVHGNYNRYYGYRNPNQEDERLAVLKEEWFTNMDVLDIGCNVGHMTLSIAQKYNPRSITGIDIDPKLISAAKRNIRHYMSKTDQNTGKFPVSMETCFGPIAAPGIPQTATCTFPNNVSFVTGNFVPEKDELVDLQKEEYDVVIALSITKWIHLNNGDDGLKRAFKRMIRALKPGGKLILEPQGWPSYKRKKNLTEKIAENYRQIRLRPDLFTEYLLSREVGFSKCETLAMPFHKAKGFQRPIQVFIKPETAQVTPQWSWNNTPNRSCSGSTANTPWWERLESQPAGSPLVHPIASTLSPLVGTSTLSPLVENSMSPLVETVGSIKDTNKYTQKITKELSFDTVSTSGIDSPVVGGEGNADSQPNTPKVKFMVGSSGFCTPCDSAAQSPNPLYSHIAEQTSLPHGFATTAEANSGVGFVTPSQKERSLADLRVQSAPGMLETEVFRLKRRVLQVGTAPGLLETSFPVESFDSDSNSSSCSSSSSGSSNSSSGSQDHAKETPSLDDQLKSDLKPSQDDGMKNSDGQTRDPGHLSVSSSTDTLTQSDTNTSRNVPQGGSTENNAESCDVISAPEVSSSDDVCHQQE